MDEIMDETIDETTIDDFYAEEEESSIVGKIIVGGTAIALGAGAGAVIKNWDRIKEKLATRKEARRIRKVNKLMDKLQKLAPVEDPTEDEEKEE